MILALELCEEIVVYGMVSDSYCRSGQPGPGPEGSRGLGGLWTPCPGPTLEGLGAVGCRVCGCLGGWPRCLVPGKECSLWNRLVTSLQASLALGWSRHLPEPPFPYV